jgi:hypothetical protein
MKFLCVACDEPMKLSSTAAVDGGSLTVLFSCPTCAREVAMLTNPWETEVVQSLGVKIGPGGETQGSRCPFSGVVREVEEAAARGEGGLAWTATALERLQNIPEFVRPMARQGVEHYARSQGRTLVDEGVLDEARERFGM